MLSMRELIPWSRSRDLEPGQRAEHPLATMQREMDRVFDELWRGLDLPSWGRGDRIGMIAPRIDVRETDEAIVVSAELPGLEEKDVEVTLNESTLLIRGEKKSERREKEKGYTYSERSFGSFERRIPLDIEVEGERVTAAMTNGVLTVTLPKSPAAKRKERRIPIGAGAGTGEQHRDKEHQAAA